MTGNLSTEQQVSLDESSSPVKGNAMPPPQPQLHDAWQCEVVVFQVENRLFSVLKKGLPVSGSVFEDMFALPANSQMEGRNADNPIVLQDTKASDFEAFLSVICSSFGSKGGAIKGIEGDLIFDLRVALSTGQWLGVLALANRWNFSEVRKMAIASLDNLLPQDAQRIRLGKRYQVEDWVRDGYYNCVSKAGVQRDELAGVPNNLDHETIERIFYIQAASLAHLGSMVCQSIGCGHGEHGIVCTKMRGRAEDARELIDTLFKDDIASAYYNQ